MGTARESLALPADSRVGKYRVLRVAGEWGFYLSYLGEDTATGARVAIHELLPEELVTRSADGSVTARSESARADFAWARERFANEGRALAACTHTGVMKIVDVFETGGTTLWVVPWSEDRSLSQWLRELDRPATEAELQQLLVPLLDTLAKLHHAGLHHLNLKPETIHLAPGGQPELVRFAGARQAIARRCHTAGAATDGYSPPEQYDPNGTEGAWTDIYGLAAVMHRAIAGQPPPIATNRLRSDPYEKLARRFRGRYSERFLIAIDAALAPSATLRPQTIGGWRRMFGLSAGNEALAMLRRHPGLAIGLASVFLGTLAWAIWTFRPGDHRLDKDPTSLFVSDNEEDQREKDAQEKEQAEKEKSEAADKLAAEKAAAEQRAADEAAKKNNEAEAAAKKAEEEKRLADEAAKKADVAKNAAEREAAKRAADEAMKKAEAAKAAAEKAESEKKAAENEAQKAAAGKAKAAKAALEPLAAKKAAAERAAAEKVAAEKMRAERMAAEKKRSEDEARKKQLAKYDTPPPPPPPTPQPTPPPAPTGPGGTVGSSLGGVWETEEKNDRGEPLKRLIIYPDTTYELSGADSDFGVIRAKLGIIVMNSDKLHTDRNSTFKYRTMSSIETDGALGKLQWTRVSAETPVRKKGGK